MPAEGQGVQKVGMQESALTPRERLLKTLRGEKADRAPLHLEGFMVADRDALDGLPDPGQREMALRIYDQTCAWRSFPSTVNRYLVTPPSSMREVERRQENGGEVVVSEISTREGPLTAITARNPLTNTVWTVKYPVESLKDIERIRAVPWDGAAHVERPRRTSLPSELEERSIAATRVSSPFVCVAGMMPYQQFLELTLTERSLIRELTEVCKARILDILDVLLADGVIEYVWIGGCEWLTPPMAPVEIYEDLVQGPERDIIERVHQGGAFAHVHCHGNVRATLPLVIERKADFFEPVEPPPDGDITFTEAKRLAAGRMVLGGNVEARVVERAGLDEVERAVRAAFEGEKQGMVLRNSAAPVGELTPVCLRNYQKVVDIWEEVSPL